MACRLERWLMVGAMVLFMAAGFTPQGLEDAVAADKAEETRDETMKAADPAAKTADEADPYEALCAKASPPSSNPLTGECDAVRKGVDLYFTWCVQCHGKEADGTSPRWGKYAGDLRKFWRGYGEFVAITIAGRPKKKMPAWGGILDADQINQIGAYLEKLALEGAHWK